MHQKIKIIFPVEEQPWKTLDFHLRVNIWLIHVMWCYLIVTGNSLEERLDLTFKIFPLFVALCPLPMDLHYEIDLVFSQLGGYQVLAIFQVLTDIGNIPKYFISNHFKSSKPYYFINNSQYFFIFPNILKHKLLKIGNSFLFSNNKNDTCDSWKLK